MKWRALIVIGSLAAGSALRAADLERPPVAVGLASTDITPKFPIRLNGYGNRRTESEGVETPLKAKAMAMGSDEGGVTLLITVDNCGVPAAVTEVVAARLRKTSGVRRERFSISSSHTHCAPCLSNGIPFIFGEPIPEAHRERIDRYTRELTDHLERVALAALAGRKPARLDWARGSVAFAANRRVLKDRRWTGFGVSPGGPVDHSLPVLRVTAPDGSLRGVLAGYACHCTTLSGNFNKVCGEWAGYACDEIERSHPGAQAMVVIGCGADANPEPRRGLDDAKAHGASLAREVGRLLGAPWKPVSGSIAASYRTIDLPFGPLPTRDELAMRVKKAGAEGYFARVMLERLDRGEALPKTLPYPIQTWRFGEDLAMVFLAGEVVVDYALRLAKECDAGKLWVVAYSNDVPCYIASRRVIAEGGYEVDTSMIYYGRPTRLDPAVEDLIVETVHDLLPGRFGKPNGGP